MTPEDALTQLGGDPVKALGMSSYHKVDRPYLGVANPDIDAAVKDWRAALSLDDRLALAQAFGTAMCMKAGLPQPSC